MEPKPKILITRSEKDAEQLFGQYADIIEPVYYPVFDIIPAYDQGELEEFLKEMDNFHWIFFTSKNSVRILLDIMKERNITINQRTRIGTVGHKTAEMVKTYGFSVSLVPYHEDAVGLLAAFQSCGCHKGPQYIGLPQGEAATPALKNGLVRYGNKVRHLILYKTVPTENDTLPAIHIEELKGLIFTSPLSVKFFKDIHETIPESTWLAVIGQPTREALIEHYREPDFVPERADLGEIVNKFKENI
jgi:uroporphyrinogen-III synthase